MTVHSLAVTVVVERLAEVQLAGNTARILGELVRLGWYENSLPVLSLVVVGVIVLSEMETTVGVPEGMSEEARPTK
jgi:hypothetical protein